MSWTWRIGVPVLFVIIGYVALFNKRDAAGEEYRAAAHVRVQEVPGYSSRPDYYDYLVDAAHDEVFTDATELKPGGRRGRGKVVVNEEKYYRILFDAMIRMANDERATHIADALAKYRLEHIVGAPAPAKAPPPGVKAATGGRVDQYGRPMRW